MAVEKCEAIVLLENVASKATERVLAAELGKLSYAAQGLFINSSSFGVPQSRTRLYMLAVDPSQVELLCDPSEWVEKLKDTTRQQHMHFKIRSFHIVM